MSQIYFKRCDSCGIIASQAITPNPPGWVVMADMGIGTLASFDLCATCVDAKGMRKMFTERLRGNAVGALRQMIPDALPELQAALGFDELVAAIEAGDYDAAFNSADGINLQDAISEHSIAEGKFVEKSDSWLEQKISDDEQDQLGISK